MPSGRFAPSPTGTLHLGNLRTALAAWLAARSTGSAFVVRMEDLDRITSDIQHERRQLADLAALGLDWDGTVVRQSELFDRYEAALDHLTASGRTYDCWCSRREIREAAAAPHGGSVRYPGTCRNLSDNERDARRRSAGRPPAVRLRAEARVVEFVDEILGTVTGEADDVVLRRNDGVPAYNLAVLVDDAAQCIEQVVRGDDLVDSAPSQLLIAELLGLPRPSFAHVPLVLGDDGERLAKRHGAVTLDDLAASGQDARSVRSMLAESLGLCAPGERPSLDDLLHTFSFDRIPRAPWRLRSPPEI